MKRPRSSEQNKMLIALGSHFSFTPSGGVSTLTSVFRALDIWASSRFWSRKTYISFKTFQSRSSVRPPMAFTGAEAMSCLPSFSLAVTLFSWSFSCLMALSAEARTASCIAESCLSISFTSGLSLLELAIILLRCSCSAL